MRMASLLALCVAVSAALLLSGAPSTAEEMLSDAPSAAVEEMLSYAPSAAAEQRCDPMKLKACARALFLWRPHSEECCAALRAQKLCFCKYLSDPELRPIIRSERGKKMAESCGVRFPDYCIIDPPAGGKNIPV